MTKTAHGISYKQKFCPIDKTPFETKEWEERDIVLESFKNGEVKVTFEQKGVIVPKDWSQTSALIAASKYFRGALGTPERESSVYSMITRVSSKITMEGYNAGYFDSVDSRESFFNDLTWLLLHQHVSFNSPVWFNIGDPNVPQSPSACYILPVQDTMDSIMDLATTEARVFKGGSGAGSDLSRIRSSRETLSGTSNTSSGPMSFARIYDQVGQVVKSGGRVRRAAKMQTMHVWHPDIEDFIWAKSHEEKKAKALIREGYDASLDGEAYSSVFFQNSNFSVRVTDEFMKAVELDQDWWTLDRHGKKFEKHRAKDILKQMADCCWECGDPGVQYDGEIQRMHTVPDTDRIWSSNPCQPADATVLTPEGIKTFGDIGIGSTIWSGEKWTKVTHKVATGTKPVFRYHTRAGSFLGTENHRVISRGERVEVKDAETIDVASVNVESAEGGFDYQTVADGLFFGDGSYKVQEGLPTYSILYVGEKDKDYFNPEEGVSEYINEKSFDNTAHRIKTTIQVDELEKTYSRVIPRRFVQGSPLQVRSFLRGLYSANGSLAGGRVTLKATSFDVIKDVQQMLSSQGIKSYYTVNKSKEVEFDNGVYVCKQSYDLNITSGRSVFQEKIGFIQSYKTSKLLEICASIGTHPKSSKRSKKSFEVVDREYVGDLPVWDIRVDAEEHTYWTGGLLVSNCSEFLHLDNTSCNLASFNLLKFESEEEGFQVSKFKKACDTLILAMDILVDFGEFPTEDIAKYTKVYRPLGLGYANLGALIMKRGLAYDSNEARQLCAAITSFLTGCAYSMSAELAEVKAPYEGNKVGDNQGHHQRVILNHYEALQEMDFAESSMEVQSIVDASYEVWEHLAQHTGGYRNSQATVLAPTGTIAFLMDCDTTGIEPEIALVKYKKLVGGGTLTMVSTIFREALANLGYSETEIESISESIISGSTTEESGIKEKHLPIFDCSMASKPGARTISWQGHAKMMAAAQPFISGAISKTINVPNDFTSEDILACYFDCWKLGLKAVALYRDGSKSIEPYSASDKSEDGKKGSVAPKEAKEQPLPDECRSIRHKFSIMDGIYGGKHTGFIHVGLYEDGSPGEIFVRMAKEGSTVSGLLDGLSMTISKALQHGVPLDSLIEKFRDARFSPFGMTRAESPNLKVCSSILDYLGRFLEDKFLGEDLVEEEQEKPKSSSPLKFGDAHGPACTQCGTITVRDGKCHVCPNCGTQVGACTG